MAKLANAKIIMSLATIKGWSLNQLDVANAFLHGDLSEVAYMTLPPGCTASQAKKLPINAVCRLHKSIYDLKQVSREWFQKFSEAIMLEGL